MPIFPASYPVVCVADDALPAIVPPVAKIRTPGRLAAKATPVLTTRAAAINVFSDDA